jgi:hypothetical protein
MAPAALQFSHSRERPTAIEIVLLCPLNRFQREALLPRKAFEGHHLTVYGGIPQTQKCSGAPALWRRGLAFGQPRRPKRPHLGFRADECTPCSTNKAQLQRNSPAEERCLCLPAFTPIGVEEPSYAKGAISARMPLIPGGGLLGHLQLPFISFLNKKYYNGHQACF